jgi:hypothetical protein
VVNFKIKALKVGQPFKAVKKAGKSGLQLCYKLNMNGFFGQMSMKDYPPRYYFPKEMLVSEDI